jgi:protein tyrosine/serine phosphatase
VNRPARLAALWLACGLALPALLAIAPACRGDSGVDRDATPDPLSPRPEHWATPLPDRPGLPNLYRVSEGLYRGAQPDDEGFAELKAMGIETVVNLRTFSSDRKACGRTGLDYEKIAMQAWRDDNDRDVEAFLRVATDPGRAPVFVHCLHGADRTGMVVAVYRVVVEGWSKDEALREMTLGGYGFHTQFDNLLEYVEELDVEAMRERAGLPPTEDGP